MSAPETIELEQRIRAPRRLIWEACASAPGLANWQADIANGDARAGGSFTLEWPAFGARVQLEIVEWVPFERLALRNAQTLVRFVVRDGALELSHRGVQPEDDAEGLASSWRVALAGLAHSVERHPGRTRRVEWAVRRMQASPETAYLFFTEPHCLDLWLTHGAAQGQEGDAFRLLLRNSSLLEGRVLARVEGRDVALVVRSHQDSLLTLRTMPFGGLSGERGRLVALVWSEWGGPSRQNARVVQGLKPALAALERALIRGGAA